MRYIRKYCRTQIHFQAVSSLLSSFSKNFLNLMSRLIKLQLDGLIFELYPDQLSNQSVIRMLTNHPIKFVESETQMVMKIKSKMAALFSFCPRARKRFDKVDYKWLPFFCETLMWNLLKDFEIFVYAWLF